MAGGKGQVSPLPPFPLYFTKLLVEFAAMCFCVSVVSLVGLGIIGRIIM